MTLYIDKPQSKLTRVTNDIVIIMGCLMLHI